MKAGLQEIIGAAVDEAVTEGSLSNKSPVILERPRREKFGDFSTNIAMLLAPLEKRSPREVAKILVAKIETSPLIKKCEIAGPGFINIFLESSYWPVLFSEILARGDKFGEVDVGRGRKVQVEFVSANPTGPLHIGHGRGAAVGDTLARVMKAAGYEVTKEYYVNDAGAQMHRLGESVRLRLDELNGKKVDFPEDHYKGEYIKEIAREFKDKHHEGESTGTFTEIAGDKILKGIIKDLEDFGVTFDEFTKESALRDSGAVTTAIKELEEKGLAEKKDGALWFKSDEFGDEKPRVLEKSDGLLTYFASDIAYHLDKLDRGFDMIVDVWGADHHGYEPRMKALFRALGHKEDKLKVVFIQLVSLKRGGEPVAMSTRAGEFVTLREVMDEVGTDACRFFFLMRRSDAQLDFDLELAKKQAPENPVFYVQYCHARIMSIFSFASEQGVKVPDKPRSGVLEKLTLKDEIKIIKHLAGYEEVVVKSALEMEPHRITYYLQELAAIFHPYYNSNRVVTDDAELTEARLLLCKAVKTVVAKGLALLGVSAPDKM